MFVKMIQEFQKFAMRGNLIDLAIGFTVGAAFSALARSLVNDIIMPPIGLLLGQVDFSNRFLLLRAGSGAVPPYATVADAQAAGAVTLNYGLFINNFVALLLVALAMFLLIRAVNKLDEELEEEFGAEEKQPSEPINKKCPYCLSTIPYRAIRCSQCTSQLELATAEKTEPAG